MNSESLQKVLKFRAPWLLLSYKSGQGLDQLGEDIENLGRPPGFFYVWEIKAKGEKRKSRRSTLEKEIIQPSAVGSLADIFGIPTRSEESRSIHQYKELR